MHDQKPMTEPSTLDGSKLWDEILKAIVSTMPSQLFPLFKEVYGRDYPKEAPVVLLNSETSSFQESKQDTPGSTFMDIALLVANTDYYHLECQMKNDSEMVIRMFAYDVRFAITHAKTMDSDTEEITLHFPHSVVIYPEKNNNLPDYLQCRVVFQDNSEHIYKIPTVRIQTYSLEEIHQKHLNLFLPYIILRLRPRLKTRAKHLLTEKELTEFLNEVILVLKEELYNEYLTEQEYQNYMTLFRFAVNRVLTGHPQLQKEVKRMTEPLIKLPSVIVEEMLAERLAEEMAKVRTKVLADQQAMLASIEAEIAAKDAEIAGKDAEIADKDAEIAGKDAEIAGKDAEIQRLRELVRQLSPDMIIQ